MTVLVLVEHDRGEPAPATWEAVTRARTLAEQLEEPLHALVIGFGGAGLADRAASYGAESVLVAEHPLLTDYGPEAWGATLVAAADAVGAQVVVAAGTERGNEVVAHAAARCDEPMVANVLDVHPGEPWSMTHVRWGGSLLEEAEMTAGRRLLTFAPTTAEPEPHPIEPRITTFEPELDDSVARTLVVDREVVSEGMTLATAPIVVGGGRGVGSSEGFGILEELAELVGGVVGCSRVATNNGWRPHIDQIGQTGTKIAPKVYIACGISGAIQHWVGAMGAKSIIAVNTDAEANMVTKADYAVVGDLHEVVPAIAAEVRRRTG